MPPTTETATRSILDRARAAIPDHGLIDAALTVTAERLRAARDGTTPEEDIDRDALGLVLGGQPVPDDLGQRVLEVRRANEAALAAAQSLARLHAGLLYALRDRHRDRADDGLSVLRAELDAILTAARPVLDALGDVTDAAGAIDADRVDPWQRAQQLAATLSGIRRAQRAIVTGAVDPPIRPTAQVKYRTTAPGSQLVDAYGHCRDAGQWHPGVGVGTPVIADDSQLTRTREMNGRVTVTSHTDRPVQRPPWFTGDPLADLRFIVRDDVEPWIPTVAELRDARDEHEQRKQSEAREAAGTPDTPQSLAWSSSHQQRAAYERRRGGGVDA